MEISDPRTNALWQVSDVFLQMRLSKYGDKRPKAGILSWRKSCSKCKACTRWSWIVAVWPEGRSARSKFETAIYLKIGFGCWVAEWVALLAWGDNCSDHQKFGAFASKEFLYMRFTINKRNILPVDDTCCQPTKSMRIIIHLFRFGVFLILTKTFVTRFAEFCLTHTRWFLGAVKLKKR